MLKMKKLRYLINTIKISSIIINVCIVCMMCVLMSKVKPAITCSFFNQNEMKRVEMEIEIKA